MNGDGGADRAGSRDASVEIHQIRMSDDPVDDVDGEAVCRIAGTVLRDEQEIPGAVVGSPRIGARNGEQTHPSDGDSEQKPFHDIVSEGYSGKHREHW